MIDEYPTGFVPTTLIPAGGVYFRSYGVNPSVGTQYVAIDTIGGVLPNMPITSSKVEVLSSSSLDTSLGTGARTILVKGIGIDYKSVSETIVLNGTTPVVSLNKYFRIISAEVSTVGVYGGVNSGNITVRIEGSGQAFVKIDALTGQSFNAHFFIPLNYVGYISGANISTDSGKVVSVKVQSRSGANITGGSFKPLVLAQLYEGITGSLHFDYEMPIPIEQCTDLFITAKTSTGTASVSIEYWGYYVPV